MTWFPKAVNGISTAWWSHLLKISNNCANYAEEKSAIQIRKILNRSGPDNENRMQLVNYSHNTIKQKIEKEIQNIFNLWLLILDVRMDDLKYSLNSSSLRSYEVWVSISVLVNNTCHAETSTKISAGSLI